MALAPASLLQLKSRASGLQSIEPPPLHNGHLFFVAVKSPYIVFAWSLGLIIPRGQSVLGHVIQAKMWASDTSPKWIDREGLGKAVQGPGKHWLLFKPLHNGHLLPSPRWLLCWRGSTVVALKRSLGVWLRFFFFRVACVTARKTFFSSSSLRSRWLMIKPRK